MKNLGQKFGGEIFFGLHEDRHTPTLIRCRVSTNQTKLCRICSTLQNIEREGGDFAVVPLCLPEFEYFKHSPCLVANNRVNDWNKICMARLDLGHAQLDIRGIESAAMFSIYHGMKTILIRDVGATIGQLSQLARAINELMDRFQISFWYMTSWNHWDTWNKLRFMCGHNPLLGVCPEIPFQYDEPVDGIWHNDKIVHEYIRRFYGTFDRIETNYTKELSLEPPKEKEISEIWISEPVRMLYVSSVEKCSASIRRCVTPFLLRHIPLVLPTGCILEYREFARDLEKQKAKFISGIPLVNRCLLEKTSSSYYDSILLTPLRPLQENLENCVYEEFEKDPVKYKAYENAIADSIRHLDRKNCEIKDRGLRVAILGAGRGPLIRATMAASREAGITIKELFILEKNRWACESIIESFSCLTNFDGSVISHHLIEKDFREWKPSCRVDLIVSELLGSFGCNEASPECLEAVLPVIHDQKWVSIPQKYSSFIAPVSSPKAHEALLRLSEKCKSLDVFDKLHIVNLRDAFFIGTPQLCFEFKHKEVDEEVQKREHGETANFNRFRSLTFISKSNAVMHGLAGQFDCTLFADHNLSIIEGRKTPGLLSWYSAYFPLRVPLFLRKKDKIIVNIWRRNNESKLWYEWNIDSPTITGICNTGGKYDFIDLR